jgi:hypothetical protein
MQALPLFVFNVAFFSDLKILWTLFPLVCASVVHSKVKIKEPACFYSSFIVCLLRHQREDAEVVRRQPIKEYIADEAKKGKKKKRKRKRKRKVVTFTSHL